MADAAGGAKPPKTDREAEVKKKRIDAAERHNTRDVQLFQLPNEVLGAIVSKTDPADTGSFAQASKQARASAKAVNASRAHSKLTFVHRLIGGQKITTSDILAELAMDFPTPVQPDTTQEIVETQLKKIVHANAVHIIPTILRASIPTRATARCMHVGYYFSLRRNPTYTLPFAHIGVLSSNGRNSVYLRFWGARLGVGLGLRFDGLTIITASEPESPEIRACDDPDGAFIRRTGMDVLFNELIIAESFVVRLNGRDADDRAVETSLEVVKDEKIPNECTELIARCFSFLLFDWHDPPRIFASFTDIAVCSM